MNRVGSGRMVMVVTMTGLTCCQTIHSPRENPSMVPISQATVRRLADLGLDQCDRVAAFTINKGKRHPDFGEQLVMDGKLNPNRAPHEGVTLTKAQIHRFLDAVALKEHSYLPAYCFFPHHALGFFRQDGSLLGHFTICLECNRYVSSVEGFVERPDYGALADLINELELPSR